MNRLLAVFTTRGMSRPEAIMLLAAAGFGPAQIADVLGVNPVTVRTTLHRARKAAGAEAADATGGNDARGRTTPATSTEEDVDGNA